MKILKFRSDNGSNEIFIPTDTIEKYHSNGESSTEIFCASGEYNLSVNTEELLKKVFVDKPDEFEIISIPFGNDSGISIQKAMDSRV